MLAAGQNRCHGITFLREEHGYRRYTLDTTQYTHHPAEIYRDGKNKGPAFPNGISNSHIAIASVEMIGNGDEEASKGCLPFGEMTYGNVYVEVSPIENKNQCPAWSPPRYTTPDLYPISVSRLEKRPL